jgi:hypothetical protein
MVFRFTMAKFPMKTLITIAIAALAASSPFVARADDTAHPGRYQLHYAVTQTDGHGMTVENKTVWKIDTVTGQVWKFVSVADDKKITEAFIEIHTAGP